jgi:8-oxo-dGTP diphosphatase
LSVDNRETASSKPKPRKPHRDEKNQTPKSRPSVPWHARVRTMEQRISSEADRAVAQPESCPRLSVAAALIMTEGRLFIAQRPPHKKFGLLWEFPGGKVEPGESLEEALHREICEELCWEVEVGRLFRHVSHYQPELEIDLFAFWCSIKCGTLCLREHVAYTWAFPGQLREYPFTSADDKLLLFLEALERLP